MVIPGSIQLDIHTFRVEERYDHLVIGTGDKNEGRNVTSLTGTTKISTILFTTDRIWLRLSTDYVNGDTGFNITVGNASKKCYTFCPIILCFYQRKQRNKTKSWTKEMVCFILSLGKGCIALIVGYTENTTK